MVTVEATESSYDSLREFRAGTLRRSALLGWFLVVVLTAQAVLEEVVTDRRFYLTIVALVTVLAFTSLLDWSSILRTATGQVVAWVWTIFITLALGLIASVPALFTSVLPLFSGVVVLTGLILPPVRHVFVSMLAILVLTVAAIDNGSLNIEDLVIPVLTLGVVAGSTAFIGSAFERQAVADRRRLEELRIQRADFERLYAVSTTLAGADSLAEGLPQIVGTICRYLDAQVGVVFLYQADQHLLRIVSPMWVNGHTLAVDDLRVRVSDAGIVSQVFRSGRTIHLDNLDRKLEQFGVIAELGLEEALVAPLRVEGHNLGVIVVGDPVSGAFDQDRSEELAQLAAPAALVLSQLDRYEAAAETTRRMQEVAQMKTDFVSVVSHELRTPLTSIIGSLDTVGRPELSQEAAAELIGSARRQAKRLQRLIEDLLMVSRIDRQAVPIQISSVPILQLLKDVARTVALPMPPTIVVEPEHLTVSADHDHLGRVFINLIENASKYAPGSSVEVVARIEDDRVRIDVVDHGDGIPETEHQRVFERFTQVERSDTRTRGGTGLGLSIVKGLVEAMRGEVGLRNTPGGGATFYVYLPPAPIITTSQVTRSA